VDSHERGRRPTLTERLHTAEHDLTELRRRLHQAVDQFVDVARTAYHASEQYRDDGQATGGAVTGRAWAWMCERERERAGAYRTASRSILTALHDCRYADTALLGLLGDCEAGRCDDYPT
jgi:hypothetical protein